MRKIVQDLAQYKEHIKELEECAVPTTPPEVRAQREKDVKTYVENIMQSIHRMTELLEKSAQLWTHLLEDGSLQELQGKEDKFHAAMVDVRVVGHGDRCNKSVHRTDRIGGGRNLKTSSHYAGGRSHDREEQPGS
jgi:hypothetical protein